MARATTSRKPKKTTRKRNSITADAVSLVPGVSTVQAAHRLGSKYLDQRKIDRFVVGNPLPPDPTAMSIGHIDFFEDGQGGLFERYMRDGYVYIAYASTPVFEDGYRVGTPEETVSEFAAENPAKFDKCVKEVQASLKRYNRPGNAYAICSAAGTRNPRKEFYIVPRGTRNFALYVDNGRGFQYAESGGTREYLASYYLKRGYKEVPAQSNSKANPEASSDAVYEQFHGAPPTETLEITEQFHEHAHLAGLGDLVEISVKLTGGENIGGKTTLKAPDPQTAPESQIVRGACNEERNQMYLVGGDQFIDVEKLGFRADFEIKHEGEVFEATEIKDHMIIGEILKITYQTEKGFDGFKTIDYFHKVGEDTKVRPFLTYDYRSQHMGIAGGQYVIDERGIIN